MKNKKQITWKYGFILVVLIFGLVFNYFNLGKEFLGFSSVGNWLIYIGFIMFIVIILPLIFNKKRIVDKRMQFVVMKAGRITFIAIVLFASIVMVLDGIKTIYLPYSYFMSYFICGIIFVYFISYNILLRNN